MTKNQKKNSLLLLLTAFIWGVAFVAQTEGGDMSGPLSFNCLRSYLGSFALFIAIHFLDKCGLTHKPCDASERKALIKGGILCGIFLAIATNLQQVALSMGTQAGKAGFLTAIYILIVPILGIFLGRKCSAKVWLGVFIALIGLYLLCINGRFSLQLSDGLVILCAFVFSLQIMTVDHYSPIVDGIRLSCIQLLVTGILTTVPMLIFEIKPFSNNFGNWSQCFRVPSFWISFLYAALLSCGVAYTLQIVAQQDTNPTVASLLMSLESVFAALAGWVIIHERMSVKEILGCVLIFAAIVLAQLPGRTKKNQSAAA